MKRVFAISIFFAAAGLAHADCDLSSISGHENNQWSVDINVREGTYSQTLDTDKMQKNSAPAIVSCGPDQVSIRQTSATNGRLCAYDLKRHGSSVSGTYTCAGMPSVQTFSGLAK